MSEEIKETHTGELEQGEFKLKKKPKKLTNKEVTTKLDLSKTEEPKKEEDAVQTQETSNSNVAVEEKKNEASSEKVVEEVRDAEKVEEPPVIEEIQEEEKEEEKITKEVVDKVKEEIKENPQLELPENVESLVNFMKETGGTVEDYVRLNTDYTKLTNEQLLIEYYKASKPHLNNEEISFLMDDSFAWEEDDEEKSIRKKKLAFKEEIAKAQNFLEETKKKYYQEIKLKPGVTQEQQKAMDFFNRYNKEQEVMKERHQMFTQNTNKLFSDEFKGFDFNVGEKQFRYKVSNPGDLANSQSDLNNFVKKFLNESGEIKDFKGYHKALYTANNADNIARHFYEQGKTDAIKNMTAKSKNITHDVRSSPAGDVYINGLKVRAISGVDSSRLKVKTKNKT
tara:strand:+ start:5126 stop:6310 length:1185 start_codon:yes stop_codon:yes gene_type:complete